jgi:Na+:H+ antiporter, NhaA family
MAPTGPADDDRPARLRLPWNHPDRRLHRRVIRPLQEFLQESTASGVLLVIAALVALVWVNAPIGDTYERLWRTTLSVGSGAWGISEDLRHWVNDGLMALFFLVVGLEIKRELLNGELQDRRTVALPVVAAIGGMVAPAFIYLAINGGGDGARGWGIAMPTDIAFTLGILALASRRAPPGLRAFVLTLAIVDDLLTFAVIALFYPTSVDVAPLLVAAGLVTTMAVLSRIHVWVPVVFVGLGVGLWVAMHASGVPAALAGVVAGLLIPAAPSSRRRNDEGEGAVSPLARIEHRLLPWTSFVILPLFALANAGVQLSSSAFADALRSPVSVGIVVGRVAGKIAGIGLATWVATRAGVARLPEGVRFAHVLGVAAAAGVAFTVSLFVTDLAFGDRPELVSMAKMGILACAPIAGILGYLLLRSSTRAQSSGSD